MKYYVVISFIFFTTKAFNQSLPALFSSQNEVKSNLRGIDVSPNGTVWVSGSNGTYGWSADKGRHWQFLQVPGFEFAEFRDIALLSDSTIVLMSSAAPAAILISTDGGQHFSTSFFSSDSVIFLDGLDFLDNQYGICYGDPVLNKMFVLQTEDGGVSWKQSSNGPEVSAGTAAFAASGSGIWYLSKEKILMLTGGMSSDIYQSGDSGKTWHLLSHLPFESGQTAGAYGMWFTDSLTGYVVGGDYTKPNTVSNNCFYTVDGGKTWVPSAQMPDGYRSVIVADEEYVVVAGISGVDSASSDDMKFEPVYPMEYNTAIIHGNMLYLAGSDGLTGSIQLR